MPSDVELEIREMVHRETRAWDACDAGGVWKLIFHTGLLAYPLT